MSSSSDADNNILKIAAGKKLNPELLKVSPAEFKGLPYEQQVHWMIAHFLLKANAFMYEDSDQESEEKKRNQKQNKNQKKEEEEEKKKKEKESKPNDDGGSGPKGK